MNKYLLLLLSLCLFSGCSSSDGEDSESSLSFSVLPPDRVSLVLDESELTPVVSINGENFSLNRGLNGGPWEGRFSLPTDRELVINVEWFVGPLLVARYENTLDPIIDSVRLEVSTGEYVTTGLEFDADADGTGNLEELRAGTNPNSAQNIDIIIPKLVPPDVIGINGASGLIWARYVTRDWNGELPRIDNLMIDRNAMRADGEAEFYWQAVHDGQSLFIIVFGESADISTPIRDSGVATRDDAVRLFFDGDNSKLSSYDGINDLYITIPLIGRRVPADSSVNLLPVIDEDGDYIFNAERQVAFGDPAASVFLQARSNVGNSLELDNAEWIPGPEGQIPAADFDGFDFANGLISEGSQVYEIKIPFATVGIEVGQPFGFEVQIDSDHNGNDSDARYGWRHPSRDSDGPDVNFTEQNPSFMGTAVLAE